MRWLFIVILFAALISGCASVVRVTTKEIDRPDHLYKTTEFDLSLSEINGRLYHHIESCEYVNMIIVNPIDNHKGIIAGFITSTASSSTIVLFKFNEIEAKKTIMESYLYSDTSHWWVDQFIKNVMSPEDCSR